MSKHHRTVFLGLLWGFLAVCLLGIPSDACAPAPPEGATVTIAQETALIVWDAETKTEHFIRRGTFDTDAADFGFLVPTPTQPELSEASDKVFPMLAHYTEPEVIARERPAPDSGGCGCGLGARVGDMADGAAQPGGVRVLAEQRVAGLDTAVLEADDTEALKQWLTDHDYPFTDDLSDWVDYYVKKGWVITAFKIAKTAEGEEPNVGTTALRMTFQTDTPFYPYREPESQRSGDAGNRSLRVYFIGHERVDGFLGEDGPIWDAGEVAWSKELTPEQQAAALNELKLPEGTYPGQWRLTEFEDSSSPRQGTADVYFRTADDQSPVERPPVIRYVRAAGAPGVMACLLGVTMLGLILRRRFR